MPKFMYKVVAKVRDGSSFMYKVYNNAIQRYCVLSREELYNAALIDSVENVVARKGSVRGINGFRLSDLPFVHESIKSASMPRPFSSIDYAINDESRLIYDAQYASLKPRRQLKELEAFIKANSYINVCAIYGLRRTGKTVLMYQMMAKLNFKDCFFATLKETSTYDDLKGLLDYCVAKKLKYVFLDEITAMPDFLSFASVLSNYYAARGLVVTITGTASYKLHLADGNPLYDRCVFINTTPVTYVECCNLLGTMSVEDYIKHYGGVLCRDIFYDSRSAFKYVDTAIVDNLQSSLLSRLADEEYGDLVSLQAFKQVIIKLIEKKNGVMTADKLVSAYRSDDLGRLSATLSIFFDDKFSKKALSKPELYNALISRIGLYAEPKGNVVKLIKKYGQSVHTLLEELDVLLPVLHYNGYAGDIDFIFSIVGLRYAYTMHTLNVLSKNQRYAMLSRKEQIEIRDKLLSNVFGTIVEHIVLQHLKAIFGFESVYVFNCAKTEFDCVVESNSSAYIMEIKWSTLQIDNQCKYLVNEDCIGKFKTYTHVTDILGRFVIYRGQTTQRVVNGIQIYYINVEDFLLNTKMFITKF